MPHPQSGDHGEIPTHHLLTPHGVEAGGGAGISIIPKGVRVRRLQDLSLQQGVDRRRGGFHGPAAACYSGWVRLGARGGDS